MLRKQIIRHIIKEMDLGEGTRLKKIDNDGAYYHIYFKGKMLLPEIEKRIKRLLRDLFGAIVIFHYKK